MNNKCRSCSIDMSNKCKFCLYDINGYCLYKGEYGCYLDER